MVLTRRVALARWGGGEPVVLTPVVAPALGGRTAAVDTSE